MKLTRSLFSNCIISLFLTVLLLPAKTHAITVTPVTNWSLTLDDKTITPASEAPGPPDGQLGRAEAKRAFGADADTGVAATISAPNFMADRLVMKASAKVTNDSTKTDGVVAHTMLKFSRIYKTKQVNSSGTFTVNMRGDIKGIDGKLITQNPFFDPVATMDLSMAIVEVDESGNPNGGVSNDSIHQELDNTLELKPSVGDKSKAGDKHSDPGKSQRTIKNNFNFFRKQKKKAGETLFFRVEGELYVHAEIRAVQTLDERKASLASFMGFVELGAEGSLLGQEALLARVSKLIDLNTGVLTAAGMSGFAEADFFSTIDLVVDTTDTTPIPVMNTWALIMMSILMLGSGYLMTRLRNREANTKGVG